MASLREQADAEGATERDKRVIIAALIADASPESLTEAEKRLETCGAPANWQTLMRAAIAEAAGEHADLSRELNDLRLRALAALPPELGGCRISDDLGGTDERASISFRPDEYLSVAFELRHFGVAARDDGRWDWKVSVSARLLDEQGNEVAGFKPPGHTYESTAQGCAPASHPGDRFTWFVYQLKARLPRDLKAGNYTVEVSVKDALNKQGFGAVTRQLEIRVR
jgi:hypothetical protein